MVVMPFTNLSGDPGQDYFAEGVTENLTTALSQLRGSFVIAHSTASTEPSGSGIAPGRSTIWGGSSIIANTRTRPPSPSCTAALSEPSARSGARGLGTSVYFRDPDGSLLEFISYIA